MPASAPTPRRFVLRLAAWCGGALLITAPPLHGQAVGPLTYEQFALPNGLEVVLAPDHSSQVVGISVWYDAGSRNEPAAKAGLARLFERLLFAGTAHVPPGGHATVATDLGGRVSASVDEEVGRFTTVLPSSRLSLGLWLEAERMGSLAVNDTTVAEARLGLLDELRGQLQNEPYAEAISRGIGSLYDSTSCAGYTHSPAGTLLTISALATVDATQYRSERYAPNRARLVVAGDLDPVATRRLVTEYFSGIPRGPDAPAATCTPGYSPGPRELRATDPNATTIGAGLFYRIPPHEHPDTPALELLEIILSQGSAGRLTSELMRSARAAYGTQGGILGERRGPGAFALFAIASPGVSADSLLGLLARQSVWAAGPEIAETDLARARTIYLAGAVSGRERPGDIAGVLQHAAAFHGSAAAANTEVAQAQAVTLADLRRVAAAWLVPANALTLVVTPEAAR
ncbi:MAG: insulinase family protein [Gemmatimonadales bacterium]|nr:insulinase family protein [Gemmatimonadales bacterium]